MEQVCRPVQLLPLLAQFLQLLGGSFDNCRRLLNPVDVGQGHKKHRNTKGVGVDQDGGTPYIGLGREVDSSPHQLVFSVRVRLRPRRQGAIWKALLV